ncbi:MAG TPA: hypothetical protein VKM93_28690 [Terriglobia bacterium]|nr:hypothetical protein [Terriglobia bacterium]
MVEPSNSPPPAGPEKPKRKYTVSDKVLEANRAKLVQANADPDKKYRPSPRRLASCYANCLKAREGKRQKRLRGQATGVKYGLAVVNLFATLGLADASREELMSHLGFFRSALRPHSNDEEKVCKASSHCAWRRSQVLHVHAVDEALMVKARLTLASEPSQDNVSARSLALLIMEVFTRRRPDLEEQLGILNRHLERLCYLFLLLRGEHEGFGEKIRWGRKIHELLRLPAEALGNPFVSGRQVEEILRQKSNAIKPLEEMKWKGKEEKEEERKEKFQKDCEEATYGGESPGGPDKVKWAGTTDYVKDWGRTHAQVGEGEPVAELVMVEGTAALEAGLGSREWPEEEERKLVEELRRQWIETSAQLRAEGKQTVGGVELSELGEALELAFYARGEGKEEEEGVGSRESEEEGGGQKAEGGAAGPVGAAAGEEQGVGSSESGVGEERESGAGTQKWEDDGSNGSSPADSPLPHSGSQEEEGVGSSESGVGEERESGAGTQKSEDDGSNGFSPADSPLPNPGSQEEEGVGSSESGVGEEREPGAGTQKSEDDGSNRSSPAPDSPLPNPGSPPTPNLREVSAAAWDRVRFLEECSRRERREMGQVIRGQWKKARDFIDALLGVFKGYKRILFEARHYEAKLQDALFRFLSQLYGGDPGFEPASPVWTDPQQYQQMMNTMEGVLGN